MYNADLRMTGYISAGQDVINLLSKFFMMVWLTFLTTMVSAQTAKVNLHKEVNIPAADMQLDELLHLVSKQAGTRFSVNTRKFPGATVIHVKKGRQPLSRLLADLRASTGMGYRMLESHIIFVDDPAPVAAKRTPATAMKQAKVIAPVRMRVPSGTATPLLINRLYTLRSDTSFLRTPLLIGAFPTSGAGRTDTGHLTLPAGPSLINASSTSDTGKTDTGYLRLLTGSSFINASSPLRDTAYAGSRITKQGSVTGGSSGARFGLRMSGKVKDTITAKPPIVSRPRKSFAADLLERLRSAGGYTPVAGSTKNRGPLFSFKPYAAAGLLADESFYINPTIQAGLPFLYAIGSRSTNFSFSMLRYGAGTSVRLSDNWRLHAQATIGRIEAAGYDSLGFIPVTVKAQLHKLSLVAEKQIGHHWRLQFGAALNNLQTTYYRHGKQAPLNKEENEALANIKYFKPPYTISNNFSPGASRSNKLWIGFQAGILYRFNFYKE